MDYTFVFENPVDVVTFDAKTIYGALRQLSEYMIENNLFLCNLAPYYQTSKRSFLLKQIHINFLEKELLS